MSVFSRYRLLFAAAAATVTGTYLTTSKTKRPSNWHCSKEESPPKVKLLPPPPLPLPASPSLFSFHRDTHGGCHVKLNKDYSISSKELEENLSNITQTHSPSSIWVGVTSTNIGLSPWLQSQGFEVHHATNETIMFNKWTDDSRKSKVPPYSTHYLSGAAVVVKNGTLLLTKQNDKWGLPVAGTAVGKMLETTMKAAVDKVIGVTPNNDSFASEESTIEFEKVILVREVMKSANTGLPDVLIAMHFNGDKLQLSEGGGGENVKWVKLEDLPLYLNGIAGKLHFPLHYLIVERVYQMHGKNLLLDQNLKTPLEAYTIPNTDIRCTIFPML